MERRRVKPLSEDALHELTTERLLAYRKVLLTLEQSAEDSDLDAAEIASLDPSFIHFKDEHDWQALHACVKRILDSREHID